MDNLGCTIKSISFMVYLYRIMKGTSCMKSNNMSFIKAVKSVIDYTKEYKKWYIISLILMVLFILSEIITNTAFSYSLSNVIEKN